jgi:uncharacterized protein YeaO (DUF488 family)
MTNVVHIKRIYEPGADADGLRVLVDRLWPRGVAKAAAAVDLWMKDVAPSTDLRRWFGHRPDRWDAFIQRYGIELGANPAWDELRRLASTSDVTLLYAARDQVHNHAVVLAERLRSDRRSG